MAKVKMTREQHEMLEHLDKLVNEAQSGNCAALRAIDVGLVSKLKEVTRRHTDKIGQISRTRQAAIKALQDQRANEERDLKRKFDKRAAEEHAEARPLYSQIEMEMQAEKKALNDAAAEKLAALSVKHESVLAECKAKREAVMLVAKHDAPLEPEKPAEEPVAQPAAQPA
jgi:hypothetical protein